MVFGLNFKYAHFSTLSGNEGTQDPDPAPAPAPAPAAVATEEPRATPEFTKREGDGLERAPGQQNKVARNCVRRESIQEFWDTILEGGCDFWDGRDIMTLTDEELTDLLTY